MAVCFGLVVNAGPDQGDADRIVEDLRHLPSLPAGRHQVSLHPPLRREVRSGDGHRFHEVSLLPVAVGYGVAMDPDRPRVPLDTEELSELGRGLYGVLGRCRGYRAAIVGWDPESFVDLDELRDQWAEELRHGEIPGLVLADEALATLGQVGGIEPFAPGFSWIPYRGEHRPDAHPRDG